MKSLNKGLSLMVLLTAGLVPAVPLSSIAGEASPQKVTITATEFALEPNPVTIDSGESVKLVMRNEGALAHNIKIDALGVTSDTIQTGKTATVSLRNPEPGTYTIYCTVPGHKQAGMKAKLEVK